MSIKKGRWSQTLLTRIFKKGKLRWYLRELARLGGVIVFQNGNDRLAMVYDQDAVKVPGDYMTIYPRLSWRIGRFGDGQLDEDEQDLIVNSVVEAVDEVKGRAVNVDTSKEFAELTSSASFREPWM